MSDAVWFGKYTLLERLSVGAMAEIFLARAFGAEGFARFVALKRILPEFCSNVGFTRMFVDEANIAARLSHANIASIYELGNVDGQLFIAMEYVHGRDLRAIFRECLAQKIAMPPVFALFIVMRICDGLDFAHNKRDAEGMPARIIHRDVTPQNVMVSYEGEVKLVDFGIAKATNRVSPKTKAGTLKGSFGYMSPEQARGLPLDRRSDIFAVGVILYELLTGKRLFDATHEIAALEKVRNAAIVAPSLVNGRISQRLDKIVMRALARHPHDRYQAASELHDQLNSYLYSTGQYCSPRELATWLRELFDEEVAESQRKLAAYEEVAKLRRRPRGQNARRREDDWDAKPTVAEGPMRRRSVSKVDAAPGAQRASATRETAVAKVSGTKASRLHEAAKAAAPAPEEPKPTESGEPVLLEPYTHSLMHENRLFRVETVQIALKAEVISRVYHGPGLIASLSYEYGREGIAPHDRDAIRGAMQELHKAALRKVKRGQLDQLAHAVVEQQQSLERGLMDRQRQNRITALVGSVGHGEEAPPGGDHPPANDQTPTAESEAVVAPGSEGIHERKTREFGYDTERMPTMDDD